MGKQASNLHEIVRAGKRRARVLAVSSGKGGVGKTNLCVNIAIALAAAGKRTAVLDADLGLANVEVLLGLNSLNNLLQVAQGERSISEILAEAPGGIRVIPGSSGIAQIADLGPKSRQKIIDGLDEVQKQFDFVLIDTMAGIGRNAVAFAAAADEVLLVTTPEPSAIVDAYAMVKSIIQARPDAVFKLIVNMAVNEPQAKAVATKLQHVTSSYLSHGIEYLGHVTRDPHVGQAVMQSKPFMVRYPAAPAARLVTDMALRLLDQGRASKPVRGFFQRVASNLGFASNE